MPTTTQRDLRAALIPVVVAITPENDYHLNERWKPSQALSDVPGGLRNFYLHLMPGEDNYDGCWGGGREKRCELRVYTSYGALDEEDHEGQIDEDGDNLFHAFDYQRDPQIAGLWSVRKLAWQYEDEADGHVWGYHAFEIGYLVDD
jgi:hypothetical protein